MVRKHQTIRALDTETTGRDLHHGCGIYTVTMCDPSGEQLSWEWDVDPLTRRVTIPEFDLREIQGIIDRTDRWVFQNPRFDVRALVNAGIKWPRSSWEKVHDTLIAGHLLASAESHTLEFMALKYCGIDLAPYEQSMIAHIRKARSFVRSRVTQEEKLLKDGEQPDTNFRDWRIAQKGDPMLPSAKDKLTKWDMWLPRAVAKYLYYEDDHPWHTTSIEYALPDSAATIALWEEQEKLLKERGLWKLYLERLKLLPVIFDMENRGVTYNRDRLEELRTEYTVESANCESKCLIYANAGLPEPIIDKLPKAGASNALKRVLFDHFKLETPYRTDTGAPSTSRLSVDHWLSVLPRNKLAYKFVKNLRDKRQRDTAVSYMDGYERASLGTHWGEVWRVLHPSLNPTGTHTLRMSSSEPNEQNISKQEGFNLRRVFGPPPGYEWWSLDYNNIELRIPAYESGEEVMIEIFEKPSDPPYFGSYHLVNASIVYPELFWPLAEKEGAFKKKYAATYYQWIKNFGFAIAYGAMPESGTADRAAHKDGAQLMVMDRLSKHTALNKKYIKQAHKYGYVETLPDKAMGRGYPIQCLRGANGNIRPTVPLNFHVQSTAMWCTCKAMIRVAEYFEEVSGASIVLQVHDEIVIQLKKSEDNLEIVEKVRSLMEMSGDDIGIPLSVGAELHENNWSEGVAI